MNKLFTHYRWDKGIPVGFNPVQDQSKGQLFKVVTDPYRKHFTIEEYQDGQFQSLVYDSKLLDFRQLKPVDQTAWQKEKLWEKGNQSACLIRNLEDRVIFKENYLFENELCRECQIYSPHGLKLATQRMFYVKLGDQINGVILHDGRNVEVMRKTYSVNDAGEFMEVIEEKWN